MNEYLPGDRFGQVGRDRKIVLDSKAADALNRLVTDINLLGKLAARPPVQINDGAAGRDFNVNLPPTMPAQLSGAASPYTFTEQYWTGTAWAAVTGGLTGSAYEFNATAGLSGKVVPIDYYRESNDWRFQLAKLQTTGNNFSGTLFGCNSMGLDGETVTLKDHATSTTLTSVVTNSSGNFAGTVTTTVGQVVDVVVSASRFASFTTSRTATSSGVSVGNLFLTPDSTHKCFTGCARPVSTTLIHTNSLYGTHTATWSGGAWSDSSPITWPGMGGGACIGSTCPASPLAVPCTFSLSSTATMQVTWQGCSNTGGKQGCPDGGGALGPCGVSGFPRTFYSAPSIYGLPFSLTSLTCPPTFSIAFSVIGTMLNYLCPTTAMTDTWTE